MKLRDDFERSKLEEVFQEVKKSLNYGKYSIPKRKRLKGKWEILSDMRRFVLWETNRSTSCLQCLRAELDPTYEAAEVTDRLPGHMKELRCLKRV